MHRHRLLRSVGLIGKVVSGNPGVTGELRRGYCCGVSRTDGEKRPLPTDGFTIPTLLRQLWQTNTVVHIQFWKKRSMTRKRSASVKVLNWGLGPHEDQIAEMVLIWSSFYTKVLIFHWRGSLLTASGWGWLIRDTIESNTINACVILNCDWKEYFSLFHSHWQLTSMP